MKRSKLLTYLQWLVIPLLLISLVGFAAAKYTTTIEKSSTVTFTATLAEEFLLQEHKALRNTDGTYTLSATEIVTGQSYTLVPGLDVPKDPHVVINGKTNVPAYLYIEIVDSLDTASVDENNVDLVAYAVNNSWRETTAKEDKHGGTVYVYTGGGETPVLLTGDPEDHVIYILNHNQVVVSQYAKSFDLDGEDLLTIYATLEEVTP